MRRYGSKKRLSEQSGATLVEFALTIGPFLLVMTVVIETIRLVIFHLAVQHVAGMAIRELILPPSGVARPRTVNSVRTAIEGVGDLYNLGLDKDPNNVQLVTAAGAKSLHTSDAQDIDLGDSGDLISLRISKVVNMFFGLGTYTVEGIAFGRVEPQR